MEEINVKNLLKFEYVDEELLQKIINSKEVMQRLEENNSYEQIGFTYSLQKMFYEDNWLIINFSEGLYSILLFVNYLITSELVNLYISLIFSIIFLILYIIRFKGSAIQIFNLVQLVLISFMLTLDLTYNSILILISMTNYLVNWKLYKIHLISELGIIAISNLETNGLFSSEIVFGVAFSFISYYFINEVSSLWRKEKIEANLLTEIIDSINDTPLMLVITNKNLKIIYSTREFQKKFNLNYDSPENLNFANLILNYKNHNFQKDYQEKYTATQRFKTKLLLSVNNNLVVKKPEKFGKSGRSGRSRKPERTERAKNTNDELDFENKLRKKECRFCLIEGFSMKSPDNPDICTFYLKDKTYSKLKKIYINKIKKEISIHTETLKSLKRNENRKMKWEVLYLKFLVSTINYKGEMIEEKSFELIKFMIWTLNIISNWNCKSNRFSLNIGENFINKVKGNINIFERLILAFLFYFSFSYNNSSIDINLKVKDLLPNHIVINFEIEINSININNKILAANEFKSLKSLMYNPTNDYYLDLMIFIKLVLFKKYNIALNILKKNSLFNQRNYFLNFDFHFQRDFNGNNLRDFEISVEHFSKVKNCLWTQSDQDASAVFLVNSYYINEHNQLRKVKSEENSLEIFEMFSSQNKANQIDHNEINTIEMVGKRKQTTIKYNDLKEEKYYSPKSRFHILSLKERRKMTLSEIEMVKELKNEMNNNNNNYNSINKINYKSKNKNKNKKFTKRNKEENSINSQDKLANLSMEESEFKDLFEYCPKKNEGDRVKMKEELKDSNNEGQNLKFKINKSSQRGYRDKTLRKFKTQKEQEEITLEHLNEAIKEEEKFKFKENKENKEENISRKKIQKILVFEQNEKVKELNYIQKLEKKETQIILAKSEQDVINIILNSLSGPFAIDIILLIFTEKEILTFSRQIKDLIKIKNISEVILCGLTPEWGKGIETICKKNGMDICLQYPIEPDKLINIIKKIK